MLNFEYSQNVKVIFGVGTIAKLPEIIKKEGYKKGVLVCSNGAIKRGTIKPILDACPELVAVYSDVTPNPLLSEAKRAKEVMLANGAEFVVAIGGGSVMDLAKFAAGVAVEGGDERDYFFARKKFTTTGLPLIAIPTTSGTGSEVTSVSVMNDDETGIKGPTMYDGFFPKYAIVDSSLTVSTPQYVTATTGLDALTHAIESYWCIKHQPVCDSLALCALKLIFGNLKHAYDNGSDAEARDALSAGSVIAGLAFAPTRTAAVHGVSYPLSINYHLTHGESCAFTLDAFIRANGKLDKDRMEFLARALGFDTIDAMADEVLALKKHFGLKTTRTSIGMKDEDIPKIALQSESHVLVKNNPGKLTAKDIEQILLGIER